MKALIAYDGSACADAALDDLKRAGLPGELEATVVTVAELWLLPPSAMFEPVLTGATEPLSAQVEAARNLAIEASRRLQKIFPVWDVRAVALVGSPASAILNKAEEWMPDLIVAGSHGRSALGRFILGSVSQNPARQRRWRSATIAIYLRRNLLRSKNGRRQAPPSMKV